MADDNYVYYGVCDGFSKKPFTFVVKMDTKIPPDAMVVWRTQTTSEAKTGAVELLVEYNLNKYRIMHSEINREEFIRSTRTNEIIEDLLSAGEEEPVNYKKLVHASSMYSGIDVGTVVCHTDGARTHVGVIVGFLNHNKIQIIFSTTNPDWSTSSRPMSKDEKILLGFPDRGKQTYFAPVIRFIDEIYSLLYQFPLHRVEQLRKEFFEQPERDRT